MTPTPTTTDTTTNANPIPAELSAAIEEEIARVFGMQDFEAERERLAGESDSIPF